MSFRETIENYLRGHGVNLSDKEHVYLRYLLNAMVDEETVGIRSKLHAYKKTFKRMCKIFEQLKHSHQKIDEDVHMLK